MSKVKEYKKLPCCIKGCPKDKSILFHRRDIKETDIYILEKYNQVSPSKVKQYGNGRTTFPVCSKHNYLGTVIDSLTQVVDVKKVTLELI